MNLIKKYSLEIVAFILGAVMVTTFVVLGESGKPESTEASVLEATDLIAEDLSTQDLVIPPEGVQIPVRWGDLGQQMVEAGVIDADKFEDLYVGRGGLDEEERQLLYDANNGNLRITQENAGIVLNLLWALGLGNKNLILEEGPIVTYDGQKPTSPDEALAKASSLASTGGWSLAKGNAMEHYSRYEFIVLNREQQELVERVSKGIYRPCCGNSTYFPDCNHGMAMLGLLELMASQGIGEEEMYKVALQVNSYWFSDTYLNIARYFESQGVEWSDVDPKEVLGDAYSSGSGYQRVLQAIEPIQSQSGGSCGV